MASLAEWTLEGSFETWLICGVGTDGNCNRYFTAYMVVYDQEDLWSS